MKIPKAKRLPSGKWFVRVRVDGMDIGITESTEAKAIAKAVNVKAGLTDVKRNPERMTVRTAVERYIDDRDGILSPSTIRAYRSYLSRRFTMLMDRRISELTKTMVQNAVKVELRYTSVKTAKNALGLISSALNAVQEGAMPSVRFPAQPPRTGKPISPQELRDIFAEVRGTQYELPILLMAFLGLRRSELMALRKSDFDFDKGTVTISHVLVQDSTNAWVDKPTTKTRAGTRSIMVDQIILDMVKAAPEGRLVQMHPNSIYLHLLRLTKRRGWDHVRVHDFRHTFASVSHLLGVPERYTMENGGWASKPVMDSVYTHTIEDGRRMYSERVAEYYRDLLPSKD